MGTGERKPPRD